MRNRTKTIVLMLAKAFPRKHRSAGKPTDFQRNLDCGKKIHTIRSGYELWKHNIEKIESGKFFLSLRQWSDKPYRSPQVEIRELNKSQVGYERITMQYNPETGCIKAVVGGKQYPDIRQIAENDGMSLDDFTDWFFGQGTGRTLFQGVIIHFTKFRYSDNQ